MIDEQSPLTELLGEHAVAFSCLEPEQERDGTVSSVRCTYLNAAAARLLGMPRESAWQADLLRRLAPAGELHTGCEHVLRTRRPWVLETLTHNDRRLRAQLTPFGERLGLWLHDVTPVAELHEQIGRMEARLEQAASENRELHALFKTVFESSPLGIAVLDRSHRYVAVNDALVHLHGQSAGELVGRTPCELWPKIGPAIEAVLDEVIRTGEPRLGNEIEIASSSGSIYMLFGSYPVKHGDEVLGTGSFVVDISDRKQLEDYQKQLLAIVSHDLRSPLQAIVIGAQMLLRQSRADERPVTNLQRILRCARRMTAIIDDLTDFTRIRVGQALSINRTPSNVDEVCRQVLSESEMAFPDRRLNYHGAGDPRGHWDPGRLAQVLTNLVSNAFKYSPPGVDVELAWWREPPQDTSRTEDDLLLEVRNGGPPVPAELLPRLFEPFRRARTNDPLAQQSLGLGLYIVKHLVKAHGGTISVTSNEEAGTVFTVRVPSSPAAEARPARWNRTLTSMVPFNSLS